MGVLIDRYIEQVLCPCLDVPIGTAQDDTAAISYHCAMSYKSVLIKWLKPRWEKYLITEFNKPEIRATIEEWLSFPLAFGQESEWSCTQNRAPETVPANVWQTRVDRNWLDVRLEELPRPKWA